MKEDILRGMIRKQIKSSLKEADFTSGARSAVGAKLGAVEKMAGVKMLKKALGQGTPRQQASGLLKVVQTISGNNPLVGKMLSRMLVKGGIEAAEEAPETTDLGEAKVSKTLSSRMDRVDKTQAMKMLQQTLRTKPATQQADFVADLVKKLELKGNINLLIKRLRGKE
jgi:hypothetical protein